MPSAANLIIKRHKQTLSRIISRPYRKNSIRSKYYRITLFPIFLQNILHLMDGKFQHSTLEGVNSRTSKASEDLSQSELSCSKKRQKSPNQETDFGAIGDI